MNNEAHGREHDEGFKVSYEVNPNLANSMHESISTVFKAICSTDKDFVERKGLSLIDGSHIKNVPFSIHVLKLDSVDVDAEAKHDNDKIRYGYVDIPGEEYKVRATVAKVVEGPRLIEATIVVPESKTNGLGVQDVTIKGIGNSIRAVVHEKNLDVESIAMDLFNAASIAEWETETK